jgi:hypothetical protein
MLQRRSFIMLKRRYYDADRFYYAEAACDAQAPHDAESA